MQPTHLYVHIRSICYGHPIPDVITPYGDNALIQRTIRIIFAAEKITHHSSEMGSSFTYETNNYVFT